MPDSTAGMRPKADETEMNVAAVAPAAVVEEPPVTLTNTLASLNNKRAFLSPTDVEREELVTYFRQRISKGHGETVFMLGCGEGDEPGLSEEELEKSITELRLIMKKLTVVCTELRRQKLHSGLNVSYFLLRTNYDDEDFLEVRIAVVGNVDAGKSTLLGVLTHCVLDNGRGLARQRLFRHKHEQESGRTSSVGNDILGFDADGDVVNDPDHGQLDWSKICTRASKVLTFIDLAGHERYLKTTVFGMTGHMPDFCMLMVGANAGVIGMTKEHLGLALALGVPVCVIVTKIDMCPANVLQDTMKVLQKLLKSPGCRKLPVLVQTIDDVIVTAMNFTSERMCPIFQVSNVTGDNLALLRLFLNLLNTRMVTDATEPAEFQIDDTFSVPGVGTVVSGITMKGTIRFNDILLLGPDKSGEFIPVTIKGIHRKRLPVSCVKGGQTASFALKKIKRSSIRKGMVMVSPALDPQAFWEFQGEVLVLHHPTTMRAKYQAVIHVGGIRQTATILSMTREYLRTGDKAIVHFRFIKHPEYICAGTKFVFREGRTKAIGQVVGVMTGRPPDPRRRPELVQQDPNAYKRKPKKKKYNRGAVRKPVVATGPVVPVQNSSTAPAPAPSLAQSTSTADGPA